MFTSLRGGMQTLVDALVAQLEGDLRLGCRVASLRYLAPGFEVFLDSSHQPLKTDVVVLATPAYVAGHLIKPIEPQLAALLGQIRYNSTATISLGYRRADLSPQHDLNGFGFMIPKSEQRQILACTWSSTKFDDRAPADSVLIRLFVGGDNQDHLVDQATDAELMALAQAELAAIMGIRVEPVVHRIFRWPQGNPQYDVGHLDRVAAIEQLAAHLPGLYLTGSAFRGIGLPDCVKGALAVVERLLQIVNIT
jgi:oxygen-dependent protoporphyrinogen oxidase